MSTGEGRAITAVAPTAVEPTDEEPTDEEGAENESADESDSHLSLEADWNFLLPILSFRRRALLEFMLTEEGVGDSGDLTGVFLQDLSISILYQGMRASLHRDTRVHPHLSAIVAAVAQDGTPSAVQKSLTSGVYLDKLNSVAPPLPETTTWLKHPGMWWLDENGSLISPSLPTTLDSVKRMWVSGEKTADEEHEAEIRRLPLPSQEQLTDTLEALSIAIHEDQEDIENYLYHDEKSIKSAEAWVGALLDI